MKKLTAILLLTFLCSCATSNMSKNSTQEGSFILNGGRHGTTSWNDTLQFQHLSWYKELAMLFDIHVTRLDKNSPFMSWLSEKERENAESCKDFLVTISYSLDSKRISQMMFMDEMKRQGFSRVSLNSFYSYLKLHPDFESSTLQLYDVYGLCGTQKANPEGITVEFPSFEPLIIK